MAENPLNNKPSLPTEPAAVRTSTQPGASQQAGVPVASVQAQGHPQTVDNPAVDVELLATRSSMSVGTPLNRGRRNYLFDKSIIAKPLNSGGGFFNLHPKNPNITLRAICARVEGAPNPYLRFEQAKSQGYVPAVAADIKEAVPISFIKDNGNLIQNGDLVLMKIDRAEYEGALKWKDEQAIRATRRAGAVDQTNSEIRRAAMETNMPPKLARKLAPFSPTEAEFNKDFGGGDH